MWTLCKFFNSSKIPQPGTITIPSLEGLLNSYVTLDDFTPDYVGPIEFRPNSTSGRGVFATEDIQPGQVILLHRTFAEVDGFGKFDLYDEPEVEKRRVLGYYDLFGTITNKIAFAPELGPDVYKLWAGEAMRTLNVNDSENKKVNVKRIQEIIIRHKKYYSATMNPAFTTSNMSLMNHSCTEANVMTSHVSNWIFNSATKFVRKGQEICYDWVNTCQRQTLEERRKQLEKFGKKA